MSVPISKSFVVLGALGAGGLPPVGSAGITTTQVAYGGTVANTIKGDAAFTFTAASGILKLGVSGSSANSVSITGASTGALTLAAAGTNQAITLTPSGTGSVNFGTYGAANPNGGTNLRLINIASSAFIDINATGSILITSNNGAQPITFGRSGGTEIARFAATTGNLLLGGLTTDGTGVLQFPAGTTSSGGLNFGTEIFFFRTGTNTAQVSASAGLALTGIISNYNSIATVGNGVTTVQAAGRAIAQVAANASVSTYTVGGSDASFLVFGNVLVTTATAHSFSMTCTYTDEGNVSRTVTLGFFQLTGATVITLITNVTGATPYESIPFPVRCKANTAITFATTGTFTTVVYNAEGFAVKTS